MPSRHCHEFNCHCGGYNYPMLSEAMNGNYTIICGGCGHEHYRYLKDGVVTEDRHNEDEDLGDTIHVMASAFSKEKRKRGLIAQFREKVAAGLAR